MTTTIGACFVPVHPPEELVPFTQQAVAAGLDEVWLWEDCFNYGGLSAAAFALAATERIRVGIGLMPVPLRNVALTAMEVATIGRSHPARLLAGLGHGVQSWMRQADAAVASPLTLLREHVEAQRSLLAGETVSVQGRYVQLDDVRLDWPPQQQPPLFIGASGPKSLALAAELGAGTLLEGQDDADIERRCAIVRAARESGPTAVPGDHPIVAQPLLATGPGAQERIDGVAQAWGLPEGAGWAGGAEQIAERMRRWMSYGVTGFAVVPTRDEPDVPGLFAFLHEEVRPLLA